ncbi:MAG: hypothetical protein M1480_13995 [Bacteroidetes bacterium]|nr:hypothetical protein [Bacteroidota bacterium]
MTKLISNTPCHSERCEESLNVPSLLSNPLFSKLQSYGLIDEIALRNLIVKNEYRSLRSKLHLGDAVYLLSQKYYLSESAINTILFRKRNKKPISFPNSIHIVL